jgi:outer membrane protein OmpA-like peptidoglycan-associated protein
MFDEEDRETGYALFLAIGLAIVVSIFTIGIAAGTAIGQIGKKASGAEALAASLAAAAPTLKLYFELGKSDLPADALTQLSPLVMEAKDRGSARWVVSGYHDASGDAAANAELAKQRALAVRGLLINAGVSAESIELAKPRVTTGGADPREARRVEVTLH